MKVTITHLKAPWPAPAGVGDTVEIPGDALPDWAVGKCVQAPDDAKAELVWQPVAPPVAEPAKTDAQVLAERIDSLEKALAAQGKGKKAEG